MHLLLTQPGQVDDGGEAVDLGQSPGDIVVLSAATSDLAVLSRAQQRLGPKSASLRAAVMLSWYTLASKPSSSSSRAA